MNEPVFLTVTQIEIFHRLNREGLSEIFRKLLPY